MKFLGNGLKVYMKQNYGSGADAKEKNQECVKLC